MSLPRLYRHIPGKVLAGLAGSLAIGLLWFVISGQAYAQPRPHNVPIAVVGPPAVVAPLAVSLRQRDAFRVIPVSAEDAATNLVEERKADAIINLPARELQTAQAASAPAATALTQIFASHPGGLTLRASELKPLRSSDPTGIALLFTGIAVIFAGFLAGISLPFLSITRRPTSVADGALRTLLILGFSVVTALLVALLSGPILGYYGGDFLTLWGWGTLLCAAVMASSAALTTISPFGAAVALVVSVGFGIAVSSVPIPWNFQSGVYRVLGPFVPDGAGINGLRDGIYFGSASQAQNLEVLAAWIVISASILLALGWREGALAHATTRRQRELATA